MALVEKTLVGRPAEKRQSIGLASRLLSSLGICLVDYSKSSRERNVRMMRWSANTQAVFFRYRYSKTSPAYFRCYFELELPIDSSFPKFLAKIEAFEDPSNAGNFTVWKKNPFFGMSEEQMKITLDLAETIEEGEESDWQED